MDAQVGARIAATLEREHAQVLRTNITVELLVLFLHVVTQGDERGEWSQGTAERGAEDETEW